MVDSQKVSIVISPASSVLSSIVLTSSTDSITAGNSIDFTATAFDQNGVPMSGIGIYFYAGGKQSDLFTTDNSGGAGGNITFMTAGTFSVYAEDQSGKIQSNSIIIVVEEQTYTCYEPVCKSLRNPVTGQIESFCMGVPYTSSVPCTPGVNDTAENACKGKTCP